MLRTEQELKAYFNNELKECFELIHFGELKLDYKDKNLHPYIIHLKSKKDYQLSKANDGIASLKKHRKDLGLNKQKY